MRGCQIKNSQRFKNSAAENADLSGQMCQMFGVFVRAADLHECFVVCLRVCVCVFVFVCLVLVSVLLYCFSL